MVCVVWCVCVCVLRCGTIEVCGCVGGCGFAKLRGCREWRLLEGECRWVVLR